MKFTAEISDTETIFFPEGGGEQMFIQGGRIPFSKYMPCLPGESFFFRTCRETDRTLQLALRVLAYVYLLLG